MNGRTLTLLGLALFAGAQAFGQDQPPLQRDLMTIAALLPGTYDNNEQVYFDRRLKLPENERHQRIRTEIRPIAGGAFGDHAFFISDYYYGSGRWFPRIYSLAVDAGERAIRMKLFFFPEGDAASYGEAHEDLSILDGVDAKELTHLPGCDLFWRPIVHGYHGTQAPRACAYEREGERVYADFQIMLDDRSLWKSDIIRRFSNDVQVNAEPEVPTKQLKARWFTCSMSFSGEGDSGRFYPIAMHDQGGEFFVPRPTEGAQDRQIGIRLRNVDWAMNNTANGFTNDVFVMYVVERNGGSDRNLTYTWGAPEETSVGLNLQWLLTSCYIIPQNQTQPYLRRPPAGPWRGTVPAP